MENSIFINRIFKMNIYVIVKKFFVDYILISFGNYFTYWEILLFTIITFSALLIENNFI